MQAIYCAAGKEEELLRIAAQCEKYSNHPVAQAIRQAYPKVSEEAENIREIPGNGITAVVDGKHAAVGNARLLESLGIHFPEISEVGTTVYIAVDGVYLGAITVADTARKNVRETINALHAFGVKKTMMLTGDNERSAAHYAKICGVKEYRAQLLPQDKVAIFETLPKKKNETVAFVGDGVNDAPVLTAADVGIAMGGVGSDAAVEAADAVLLNDDISKLPMLFRIAKRTCAIARQNIAFALSVKAVCLILGALGYAPMWLAIFADVGVAVLAILNALRGMREVH